MDAGGETIHRVPLRFAAENGKLDAVQMLVARGADVNATTGAISQRTDRDAQNSSANADTTKSPAVSADNLGNGRARWQWVVDPSQLGRFKLPQLFLAS